MTPKFHLTQNKTLPHLLKSPLLGQYIIDNYKPKKNVGTQDNKHLNKLKNHCITKILSK